MRQILVLASILAATGCELMKNRHHDGGGYSYCDSTGCYDCDAWSCVPVYQGKCFTDWDCQPGQYCNASVCASSNFCEGDKNCAQGFVCDSRSTCVQAVSPASACKQNSDCKGGFCDERSGVCVTTFTCYRDADCGPGWTCDTGRNVCVPMSCSASSDCMEMCYCDRGNCIETGTCQSDKDCASLGMVCDTSRATCQPSAPPPAAGCKSDAECPAGQSCCDGACKTLSIPPAANTCERDAECAGGICRPNALGEGLCHKACNADGDCGTGDTCQDGHCFKNPTPPITCIFNRDCGGSFTCINATCHPDCAVDADCPNPADFCDQGICQPDWRRKSECTIDSDCAFAKDQCVDGTCATRCLQDADCAGCPHGPTCVMGYCAQQ
jgi:hypothetical protein